MKLWQEKDLKFQLNRFRFDTPSLLCWVVYNLYYFFKFKTRKKVVIKVTKKHEETQLKKVDEEE